MDEVRSLLVNVVLPDGSKKERKVITAFTNLDKTILVFATDRLENGNKVVGISYLKDGMYQAVEDMQAWNDVKTSLVSILHDELKTYYKPEAEIIAAPNLEHFLALRDANYEKLETNYKAYLKGEAASSVDSVSAPMGVSDVSSSNVVESPVNPVSLDGVVTSEPISNPIEGVTSSPAIDTPQAAVMDVTAPPVEEPTPTVLESPVAPLDAVATPSMPEAPVIDLNPLNVAPAESVAQTEESAPVVEVQPETMPESIPVIDNISAVIDTPNTEINQEQAPTIQLNDLIPPMNEDVLIPPKNVESSINGSYEQELIELVNQFQMDLTKLKEKYGK